MTDLGDKIARAMIAEAILKALVFTSENSEAFEAGVRSAVDAVNSTPPSNLKPYLRGAEQ